MTTFWILCEAMRLQRAKLLSKGVSVTVLLRKTSFDREDKGMEGGCEDNRYGMQSEGELFLVDTDSNAKGDSGEHHEARQRTLAVMGCSVGMRSTMVTSSNIETQQQTLKSNSIDWCTLSFLGSFGGVK
jgi:hypothetical protein